MALKRREWSSPHEGGWATRRYRRKIGCTVTLDGNHGYDMTIGGYWVGGGPDGEPGTGGVGGTREGRLRLPWMRRRRSRRASGSARGSGRGAGGERRAERPAGRARQR